MSSLARAERAALLDLLADTGPGAPTLCEGWTTHDLAAHLLVRERQPLALPGYLTPRLHGVSARFEQRARATPYGDVLAALRAGPPAWSPLASRLDGVYDAANLHEFFVHHEDVRRLVPAARPRREPGHQRDLDHALWARLRLLGPLLTRRAGDLRIELVTPGAQSRVVHRGARPVLLRGRPGELFLWLFGRRSVAEVEVDAAEADRAAVLAAPIGP